MIPIGPIIAALYAAQRHSGRGTPPVTVFGERAAAVVLWLLVFPMLTGAALGLWQVDSPIARSLSLVLGTAQVVLAFPWALSRYVAVPRGWIGTARRLVKLSYWAWGGDREGGSIAAGALALSRSDLTGEARELALGELEARLDLAKLGHGGLLLARSLLARLQGDDGRADRLLEGIALLPNEMVPGPARAWASEVVIGEALARGDLDAAARIEGRGSARARLLAACARALARPEDRTPLRAAWIRALSWLVWPRAPLARLVADATSPSARAAAVADVPLPGELDPAHAAILWLARAERAGRGLAPDCVVLCGSAVDDALGAVSESFTDAALREQAEDALHALAELATKAWSPRQRASASLGLGEGAAKEMDALADICERLEARQVPLQPAIEAEEWVQLRLLYHQALASAGDDAAYEPYATVQTAVWNHGAHVFNAGQKTLGRAMFLFLREEAKRRGDTATVKAMNKNLRAT